MVDPNGQRPLRVLHGPEMVGGHAQELARAERALGLDSWSVVWQMSPLQFRCDEILCRGFGLSLMAAVSPQRNVLWNRLFGRIELSDLPLLKYAGKTIVFSFQDDDARQGDRLVKYAEFYWRREFGSDYYSARTDARKR
jgi:hypothetical protein